MSGPLQGLVVLDLTQQLVGPGATMLLGDMGADVIRVDPPPHLSVQGDDRRGRPRTSLSLGRSKRNVSLDLTRAEGRDVLYALARRADVLVQNLRPGLAERLGVAYETIRALNPGIIYCEINAYGHTGPDRHRVGFDIIAQAGGGSMVPNPRNSDLPAPVTAPIADVTGMVLAALGVVAALRHRDLTGEGQVVRTSLLDGVVLQGILRLVAVEGADREMRHAVLEGMRGMVANGASYAEVAAATATGLGGQFTGAAAGAGGVSPNVYYRTYRTSDSFVAVGCLNLRQQRRLSNALGLADPRFEPGASAAAAVAPEVLESLQARAEALFLQKTTAEWVAYLDAREVACGPVLNLLELFESPHHIENQMVAAYDDAREGRVRFVGYPIKFDKTPMAMQRPAPVAGEYSDEVLARLGYADEDIARLREEGVVF